MVCDKISVAIYSGKLILKLKPNFDMILFE